MTQATDAVNPTIPRQAADRAQATAMQACLARLMAQDSMPAPVKNKASMLFVDTLACILAGRQAPEVSAAEQIASTLGGSAFSFPGGPALSLESAAAIGAMASAWDEACEGLPYAHGRPGLALIGALVPLAVVRRSTLAEVLGALHLGYEIGARAGGWLRIRPGMHVDGNWPAIGVAAGIARLMRLNRAQIWHAISIAACQLPTSLYAPIRSGDMARNTYLAHVAQLGLMAASSAAAGITAPEDALLLYAKDHAVDCGTPAPDPERDFLLDAYLKPHASVRHAHYGLEAAIQLRDRIACDTSSIDTITLEVYEEAATYAGNRAPARPLTGQFSLSLAVAAGLRFGEMGPEIYREDRFFDPELRRLEALTQVIPRPELGAHGQRAGILTIERAAERLCMRVDTLAGSAERPLATETIIEKFVHYAQAVCEAASARAFAQACFSAPPMADLAQLWSGLAQAPRLSR